MSKPTILAIILAAAVITVGGYFLLAQGNEEDMNNATNTVVMTNENVNTANVNSLGNLNTNIDTTDWLTYTNEKYGYSVKYPGTCTPEESKVSGDVLVTTWHECNFDVFVDNYEGESIEQWMNERNYNKLEDYIVSNEIFTIANFKGESTNMRVLALVNNNDYMYRIDLNNQDINELKKILDTFIVN